MEYHIPVLPKEVVEYLQPAEGKRFIDATLGDGGHTLELLKKGAQVLGIDYNEDSLQRATQRINTELPEDLTANFKPVKGNFKNLEEIATKNDFTDVDGVLMDLGYSSYQLDDGELGLSFNSTEPLDMRVDTSMGVTAADIVNTLSEKQLDQVFREYGEEGLARKFAKAILERRELKKFETTADLANLLVERAPPGYDRGKTHPARRVFQALRILVNGELENLKLSLPQAARLLKLPGGRMAVISFHSLEDRMVKNLGQAVQPAITLLALTKKPITPTYEEIRSNKRSKSAKMRVYERTN